MILIKYLHQKSDQGSIREQDIYRSSFKLRKIYSYITIKLHMHKINSYYRHTNSVHMLYLQASIFHHYIQFLHKTRITSSSILPYSFTWFFASLCLWQALGSGIWMATIMLPDFLIGSLWFSFWPSMLLQILIVTMMMTEIFLDVTLCWLENSYQHCEGTALLRNNSMYVSANTEIHPRRFQLYPFSSPLVLCAHCSSVVLGILTNSTSFITEFQSSMNLWDFSSHTGADEDSSVQGYKMSVTIHQTTRRHMQ